MAFTFITIYVIVFVTTLVNLFVSIVVWRRQRENRGDRFALEISADELLSKLHDGLVVLDSKKRIVAINNAAVSMLGILKDELFGEKLEDVFPSFQPYLSAFSGEEIQGELRLELNGMRYLEFVMTSFLRDADEKAGFLVVLRDITVQKENELYLLQRTRAIEQSPGTIVVTDSDGVVSYVNPQFTLLTGYEVDEAIGNKMSVVSSGLTPASVYKDMWETILAGETWRGEFLNRKKNGELYWEWAVIAPVQDASGEIVNFIAVKENITERKKAEEALKDANQRLRDQLREIRKLEATLRDQAIRDPLTKLYNRRFLVAVLGREFSFAERRSKPLSIIILDIDHFKLVNDTYGHQAGDECLVVLAELLKDFFREADIVCRFGGEEFLVVLPDSAPEFAKQRAEEFRKLVFEESIVYDESEINLTISLGVASYPTHGDDSEEVVQKADQALYDAKHMGRNCVVLSEG